MNTLWVVRNFNISIELLRRLMKCGEWYEIVGYKDRTKRICHKEGRKRICEKITYQIPKRKRVCHYETYLKPYTKCRYIYISQKVTIGCLNPNGDYTNSLYLENFEYQIKGESWKKLVPEPEKINIEKKKVRFRVTIPDVCNPKYDLDSAVVISDGYE